MRRDAEMICRPLRAGLWLATSLTLCWAASTGWAAPGGMPPTPTATPMGSGHRGATPAPAGGSSAGGVARDANVNAVRAASALGPLVLDPIPSPVVVGSSITLTGSGFTPGSVIIAFVQTGTGIRSLGPYVPASATATELVWNVSPSVPLGHGFIVLAVVNPDEDYRGSNFQSQRLYGNSVLNLPTILSIDGSPIQGPDASLNGIYVNVALTPGDWVVLGGSGFNNPGVNLFTASGNLGPLPVRNITPAAFEARIPPGAPLGLAAFEVVNAPYVGNVGSQVVYASLGGPPTISGVVQNGSTVTIAGTGFAAGAVINLFNRQGGTVANLGGVFPTNGAPRVPLTALGSTELRFAVPFNAITGPSYVQVINPPYIGFTSTGNDPDGGFAITGPAAPSGGSSLRFFGGGAADLDRVKIALGTQSPGLPVDVGADFTVELWVKTAAGNPPGSCGTSADGWRSGAVILDRDVFGSGDVGDYGIALYGAEGRVAFGVARGASGATICGTLPIGDGAWHHVAATRTAASGVLRLFIDGQPDGAPVGGPTGEVGYRNGRATSHPTSDPFLVLGAEKHDIGLAFRGWIDEVRISRAVRYTSTFARPTAPFTTDPQTAALYHLDEGNGNVVTDSAVAAGGPSPGLRRATAAGSAPQWSTESPFTTGIPTLALQTIATVTAPTSIASCGDQRLFITEQGGAIRIWDGSQLLPIPFLTVSPIASGGERGLFSIAFHPDYAQNGFFFVAYTDPQGSVTIARYRVSGNPNLAVPSSRVVLLSIPHPISNHNGGQLQFGPDGYLYAGIGDGGGGCDDTNGGCNAQRTDSLLGKLLRIDVNQNVANAPFYGIPPSNPFTGTGGFAGEVWSYGLRNPWRFSFDRLTRALFIGDVGQNAREEVDYQAGDGPGGHNYGWKMMEGFACNTCPLTGCPSPPACNSALLTPPILDYSHSLGCAITGGYVYRGTQIPFLTGRYIFGDLCSGRLWWAAQHEGSWTATQFTATATQVYTFGEDFAGELYLGRGNGTIAKLVPVP